MKPVLGKASASAIRCSPPPNPISSLTSSTGGSNSSGETGGAGAGDVERQARQQLLDQIGLVRAQFVTLAPPEERAVPVRGIVVARSRSSESSGSRAADAHRSVWYSRYNSRVRGSIDEMYICS